MTVRSAASLFTSLSRSCCWRGGPYSDGEEGEEADHHANVVARGSLPTRHERVKSNDKGQVELATAIAYLQKGTARLRATAAERILSLLELKQAALLDRQLSEVMHGCTQLLEKGTEQV
jgi:hypothetical protein